MKVKGFWLPIFIIIAGIIISGSIFASKNFNFKEKEIAEKESIEEFQIKPISDNDRVLGNPSADIILVEYSDFECPFCKQFHTTMNRLMEEYGKTGRLAWVYRHFPIEEIHPNARYASVVSECVGDLAGEQSFWDFSNQVFEDAPNSLSPQILETLAYSFDITKEELMTCTKNPEIQNRISESINDGMKIYENDPNFGTPYSFLLIRGQQINISGAQPYSIIKQIIEENL